MKLGKTTAHVLGVLALVLLAGRPTNAQRARGELRIEVHDPQGAAVPTQAELVSDANEFRRTFQVGADGHYALQDLPFGVYRLSVNTEGFAPWSGLVEVGSEVPVHISVTLALAAVATQVQVSDAATLVDPSRTGTVYPVGHETLGEVVATQPGRSLSDLVDDLPGWLYEANGVLHPRGSEYDVQYVIDGLPITENRSRASGFSASYERDFSDRDRLRLTILHNVVRFLVPNEFVQQKAGQRQDIINNETTGQVYFQHIVSPDLLLSFSGRVRDAAATLSSNPLATPVIVSQDRGYREGYARGDLAGHHGHHDWKVGTDVIANPVREKLQYNITDPTQFDPGTQQRFQFSDHRRDVEPSAYAQDHIRLGYWNLSAGLRFDHYGFVAHQSAWSPRIGVSRYFATVNLLLHASYDRVFQTPAVENLLLASSPQLDSLNPIVVRLPVQSARANYYEVGFAKAFFGNLRLDGNVFRRDFRNYSDDDVLLDTGVSFT